jgi:hypothetical protein
MVAPTGYASNILRRDADTMDMDDVYTDLMDRESAVLNALNIKQPEQTDGSFFHDKRIIDGIGRLFGVGMQLLRMVAQGTDPRVFAGLIYADCEFRLLVGVWLVLITMGLYLAFY